MHKSANFQRLLASLICMVLLAGCCPPPPPDTRHALNPANLLSTAEVIARINANNSRLPTLWASLNYNVTIIDEQGKSRSVASDDGTLLFAQREYFRLRADKEFVGTVFDFGTNQREFWCEVVPGLNTLYRGSFVELAKMDPRAARKIPVRPDLIRDVLGVGIVGPNLLSTPIPLMRFDPVVDSYVILFGVQTNDHWVVQKQIWYDRTSVRPRRVIVYGSEGEPELDAELSYDLRVSLPNEPAENWPLVAGNYRVFLPYNGSHMEFTLKDVRLSTEGNRGVRIPNPANFEVPDVSETGTKTIYVTGSRVD